MWLDLILYGLIALGARQVCVVAERWLARQQRRINDRLPMTLPEPAPLVAAAEPSPPDEAPLVISQRRWLELEPEPLSITLIKEIPHADPQSRTDDPARNHQPEPSEPPY